MPTITSKAGGMDLELLLESDRLLKCNLSNDCRPVMRGCITKVNQKILFILTKMLSVIVITEITNSLTTTQFLIFLTSGSQSKHLITKAITKTF